jgi:dTDP-4-dehydrorhamnose reductase
MRILVTGGTGLLGRALAATVPKGTHLSVLHFRNYPFAENGVARFVVDVRERRRLSELFESHRFDVIIHAAGIANVDYVERNFEEGWKSNVNGTENIVELTKKHKLRLVYVSSNAVFDGKSPPYQESDSTNPINKYGVIKRECERIVMMGCPDAAIVRPILMYGWHGIEGRANPATWIIERLRKGERINLVTDVYENPLWSNHCAEAIWKIVELGKTGIFHIAGKDVVNRYEFAKSVAEVFGLDHSLLNPVKSSFFPTIALRPPNTSFRTERMEKELHMYPLPLLKGLEHMRASLKAF